YLRSSLNECMSPKLRFPRGHSRLRDPGVLHVHNLPMPVTFFGKDGRSRLKISGRSTFVKLQVLAKRDDRDIRTNEANLLDTVPYCTALIDGAQDHAMPGLDGGPTSVVSADNVDEISVLGEGFGKTLAIGRVPCRFEMIDHLVQRFFVVGHFYYPFVEAGSLSSPTVAGSR